MPFRGKFNLSKVLAQTKSAKVESKPPEIPTTTVLQWVCTKRLASPAIWMAKISSQRSSNSLPWGTKGWASILRVRLRSRVLTNSVLMWMAGRPGQLPILAAKVVLVNRSPRRRSTSISLMTNCSLNEKRSDSVSNVPFSYISPLPAKTTSVVDSPKPDELNTYPARQRADCWLTNERT